MKTYCKISIFKHGIYDSFIYKKKLYLVTLNKEIIPMDWVDFIDNITPKRNAFPFKVAFTRSDILYSPQYEIFIKDSTIQKDLVESFSELKDFSFNFDDENFKKFVSSKKYWKQLCELPRDIKCANNQFYIMNDNEVLASKMQYGKAISNRSSLSKFHTFIKGSFVSMEFVGRDIFLAAQDDGVYLCDYLDEDTYSEEAKKISSNHASYLSNNFSSLTVGSYYSKAHLLKTSKEQIGESRDISNEKINLSDLFEGDEKQLICSFHDKIYSISNNEIKVAKYTDKNKTLSEINSLNFDAYDNQGEIISAEVAIFGLILEYKKSILVLPSNNENPIRIGSNLNPIVGWRIFPNSIDYKNQIHVYFDDRIEIWSFNHDYFVNQFDKKIGARNYYQKRKYNN